MTHQQDSSTRPYAYLPVVAGGTAFTYQILVAGKKVTNLRLSGETIAKIFTNQITNWNDPAITKDNNGHALPSLPITPVVRSDGSGATAQFTLWMDKQYPSVWRAYNGASGLTSLYPRKGRQIAAAGDDGIMNTVSAATGNGTIATPSTPTRSTRTTRSPTSRTRPATSSSRPSTTSPSRSRRPGSPVATATATAARRGSRRTRTSTRTSTASTPRPTRAPTRSRRTPT